MMADPIVDDLVIEELPEEMEEIESIIHDQLPTIDEYRAINSIPNDRISQKRSKISRHATIFRKILSRSEWTLLCASIVIFLIGLIGLVVKNKSMNLKDSWPSDRTIQVENFLFERTISSLSSLANPTSPQHYAAVFVADGDTRQMDFDNEISSRRFLERYILSVLFYEFNGPAWFYNLNFLSSKDHCDWYDDMVTADGKEIRQGVICNTDGFVSRIHLAWNNLQGNKGLPREIQFLENLETLHLYNNGINGQFPEIFRNMSTLKAVGLMKAGLTGTIPDWIGEMTQLTTLALGNNKLHGTLPPTMSSLSKLRILGLDGNNIDSEGVDAYKKLDGAYGLAGTIDPLKRLTSLEALYLEDTSLTGDLKGFNWPNLVELDVSNTYLDASFPVELLNHPTLRVLDINNNVFMDGVFPNDLFENPTLEYLSAHNCGLKGAIPDRIGFLKNLKHLDLSFNELTGTIPDIISQLSTLRYLSTSGNNFTEQVLMDMSRLTDLTELSMKGNNLIGRMPGWISSLTNLKLLDLDANGLLGSIPNDIGRLTDLRFLLLNRNGLTGTIPNSMKNIKNLDVLLLDSNNIRGDAQAICEQDDIDMKHFIADCYPGANGQRPEVSCRCCTQCCADGDMSCNDKSWTSNFDPIWEYGIVRPNYSFRLENAPAGYSKRIGGDIMEPLEMRGLIFTNPQGQDGPN